MAFVTHMNASLSYVCQRTEERSALRFSHSPSPPARRCALDPQRLTAWSCWMVFKTKGIENLDAVINVRLTNAEKERLQDDADIASMSMSELVRARYFGRPVIANADMVMVKELRRLGGLLKQVHTTSDGAYSKTTAAILVEINGYIEKLSKQ